MSGVCVFFAGVAKSNNQVLNVAGVGFLLGGLDFSSYALKLSSEIADDGKEIVNAILYGKFINSIISFLIIAFCLFLTVKVINRFRRKAEAEPEAPAAPPSPSNEEVLLTEIRDLLKKDN